MAPGELNQRITFLARAAGQDDLGQPSGAWAPVATDPEVWARSANASARDLAFAGGHQSTVDAKWIIRHRSDIEPTWRVQWQGEHYQIVGEPACLAGGTEWLEIRGRKLRA